jgi:hypothetical protein
MSWTQQHFYMCQLGIPGNSYSQSIVSNELMKRHLIVLDSIMHFKEEAALWAQAGALGLRAVLPTSWDVH